MDNRILVLLFFIFSSLFMVSFSKADQKYLGYTPAAIGGYNYRNYADTVPNWNSIIFYGKTAGKYILSPGTGSISTGNPDSGTSIGYGWVTNYTFQGPIRAGNWNFSTTLASNVHDIGYLGFVVYKTCAGNDYRLFGVFNKTNSITGSKIPEVYTTTFSAPSFDVTGCSLKVEYWLNVTSVSSSNANMTFIHGSNSWIQFPNVLDIVPPAYSSDSVSSSVAGTSVTHSLFWQDDGPLGGYIFSFDNGTGTFINDSYVAFSGTTNWSNATKIISSTPGATIRWCVYAKDAANNWNGLSCLNPFSYATIQAPHLVVEKKILESKIAQNSVFTVQVLYHNDGSTTAFNVTVNDSGSIPSWVTLNSGDTSWIGQLGLGEGDGFSYTLTTNRTGYLKLNGAVANYLDSSNAKYSIVSDVVETYILGNSTSQPSVFDTLYDNFSKPVSFVAILAGLAVSIYGVYNTFVKKRLDGALHKEKGKLK